jgi:hypothetical protein
MTMFCGLRLWVWKRVLFPIRVGTHGVPRPLLVGPVLGELASVRISRRTGVSWVGCCGAYRVHDAQTYRETIACVEKVASVSLSSLAGKSEEEKTQLIRRITGLSEKLHNAIDSETSLVISLTLLTAIRVQEQTMHRVAKSTASGR